MKKSEASGLSGSNEEASLHVSVDSAGEISGKLHL